MSLTQERKLTSNTIPTQNLNMPSDMDFQHLDLFGLKKIFQNIPKTNAEIEPTTNEPNKLCFRDQRANGNFLGSI